jgi:hypothetical protein
MKPFALVNYLRRCPHSGLQDFGVWAWWAFYTLQEVWQQRNSSSSGRALGFACTPTSINPNEAVCDAYEVLSQGEQWGSPALGLQAC